MNHQEDFEGAYSGHHRTYRQQPPAHVPMLMEPCPNLIPPFFRVSETAENERGKQQDRIGDKIESPAVYHPVGKGQQRQERTHVPASHQQCLAVARSPPHAGEKPLRQTIYSLSIPAYPHRLSKTERKCTIFPAFTAGLRGVFYNFVLF